MSFRARLLLGIGLTLLLAAGVQAGLGYSLYSRWLEHSAQDYVARFLRVLTPGVDLAGEASFRPERLASAPSDWSWVRYRLVQGDALVFQGPEAEVFPAGDPLWTRGESALGDGYRFEVALNLEEIRQSLEDYRRTTLMTLILTLVVASGLTLLLFRFSMQPIRRLTEATRALSRHRFQGVRVPPGQDEVAALARSFNEMSDAIAAYLERERSFTRYASHELRTPLSTLRAQVEALELGLLPQAVVVPALKTSLTRMETILTGLLTLARATTPPGERVALDALLAEAITQLPAEEQARVEVQGGDRGHDLQVLGRPELLTQALFNLLDNAVRHGCGDIRVAFSAGPAEVTVTVRDRGDGVPETLIERLPEPFFQHGERGSVGLGLALVRHIAETLGGRLELRNVEGGFEAALTLRRAP